MNMKHVKKILIIVLVIILLFIGYLIWDNSHLAVDFYEIDSEKISEEFGELKILQISDLHSKEFGKNNIKLINKIKEINPDYIFVTGDAVSRSDKNGDVVISLIEEISNDYRIYYILGNHELDLLEKESIWVEDYLESLESYNVIILRDDYVSIEMNEQVINIYGLEIPRKNYTRFKKYTKTELNIPESISTLNEEDLNILLAHNPAYFDDYVNIGYDLVFSGHIHGGLIRFPFIGGVLSSDVTLFPKYNSGLYGEKTKMFVSRGLGGLRVFNRPNLIVVNIS